jgi:hypothetical protein
VPLCDLLHRGGRWWSYDIVADARPRLPARRLKTSEAARSRRACEGWSSAALVAILRLPALLRGRTVSSDEHDPQFGKSSRIG